MSSPRTRHGKERIIPITIETDDTESEKDFNSTKTGDGNPQEPPERHTSTAPKEDPTQPSFLPVNCKEKIILVVDTAEDENATPFHFSDNTPPQNPLAMLKRAISLFVQLKSSINRQHEFAVITLTENSAHWVHNFTPNPQVIANVLDKLTPCPVEDIFSLNTVFKVLHDNREHIELPLGYRGPRPEFVVRAILFYNRSHTQPKLRRLSTVQEILNSPYFTMDVVMTHEPVTAAPLCDRIFCGLQNLDKKGYAHFYPVARDARVLFEACAKLLGHPLQRAPQQLACYKLEGAKPEGGDGLSEEVDF